MIIGIGVDIVETERLLKAIQNERFISRCYTGNEIQMFYQRKKNVSFLAGNFASKEAVSKAFGTGFSAFSPVEVEVLRNESGKPYINLYGRALELSKRLNVKIIHISITNTDDTAIAYVVAEG